ncbi:MAG: exonuclease SbcCD subunit D [Anaerolineae bacterium]|nr:exonuclease SbcCD subunit D [Anaerolineae bacterium]
MIRMLHFADLHLGMENYGHYHSETGVNSRITDFLKRLDGMVQYALANEVDLVIFAGDAFKNRTPNPTLQREFANRVKDLADHCPVVLLVGNHDLAGTYRRASSIEIYKTLDVPQVLVGDNYELWTVHTANGPVLVGTAPYPLRTQILGQEDVQGLTIAQVDEELERRLQFELIRLADEARACPDPAIPRVLVGHFSVLGATLSSEQSVMIGRDVRVPLSELADPAWDYVALGHIHRHQNLTATRKGAPPVVYSGNIERIDFGEEGDSKGFCWVELERGNTRWQFVPVDCRPFVTLRIDCRADLDPMQRVAAAIGDAHLEGAIVRLIVQTDVEGEGRLQDKAIAAMLREAGVDAIAAIKKEVERGSRARLGSSADSLSDVELLERYFVQKGFGPDQVAALLERAALLMGEPLQTSA